MPLTIPLFPANAVERSAPGWTLLRLTLSGVLAAHAWGRLLAGGVVTFGAWLEGLGLRFGFVIAASSTVFEIIGTILLALRRFVSSLFGAVRVDPRRGYRARACSGRLADERNKLASTEIYDARTNTFTAGPPLLSARFKIPSSAGVLRSGEVVIAGGARDVELWRPGAPSFTRVSGTHR